MNELLEKISEDALDGKFKEQGLPLCVRPQLEYIHRGSVQSPSWLFIPVRDYWDAERMLAATGFTPLFVNLESMTAKPKAVRVTKKGRALFCACRQRFCNGLGKRAAAAREMPHM